MPYVARGRHGDKRIYDIDALMNKLGVSNPDDLREYGYDVDDYYERKNEEEREAEEYDETVYWNWDNPGAPDYMGT